MSPGELDASSPGSDAATASAADAAFDAGSPDATVTEGPDATAADASTLGADGGGDANADAEPPVACWATVTIVDSGADAEEKCTYTLPCGLGTATISLTAVGCRVLPALSDGGLDEAAAPNFPLCYLRPDQGCEDGGYVLPDSGGVVFDCVACAPGGGRRPADFRETPGRGATRAGAYLAKVARLEAASVRAFEELAAELQAHGAPESLVAAARASARDEVRHARAMNRLATRFGGATDAGRRRAASRAPRRSLAALARENAVEGCVRETFGALVNAWQAARASDGDVRARIAEIARDELRHAALSWETHVWVDAQLSLADRRAVARAMRSEMARLARAEGRGPTADVRDLLGLPSQAEARALAMALLPHVGGEV